MNRKAKVLARGKAAGYALGLFWLLPIGCGDPDHVTPACRIDSDCRSNRICVDGKCLASGMADMRCSGAADCPPGQTCNQGLCEPSISVDNDCGSRCLADQQCRNGLCVGTHTGANGVTCTGNNDCLSGWCNERVCQTPPPVPVINQECGDQQATFSQEAPNVFVLLDYSGSMADPDPTENPNYPTDYKWASAKAALDQVAENLAGSLRFGIATFPGDHGCTPPMSHLRMGQHTAEEIKASYADIPNPPYAGAQINYTPTAKALSTVQSENWVSDPDDDLDDLRNKVVLLITDGKPNCGDDVGSKEDVPATVAAAASLLAAGVRVYVVGFGGDTASGSNPQNLDMIAAAGGTSNPTDPAHLYFQANDTGDLETAIAQIAQIVVRCELRLSSPPPDPDRITVKVNGVEVPRDPENGFDYNATPPRISLRGSACDLLKAASSPKIEVIYGCAGCGSNRECAPTQVCIDRTCGPCRDSLDCDPGLGCSNGSCITPSGHQG